MAKRSVTFDVKVNTPSAQQEATRVANIFQSALKNVQVGTKASGSGGGSSGGGGGGGGGRGGMPGSSIENLIFGSAQYALAGRFYQFFSQLPENIMKIDEMATANRRAAAAFATLAGGADKAKGLVDAYVRGSGNVATQADAMTEGMRLYDLGLGRTSQQMQKFTTVSRGMAQATGRDVGYIQEQFSLAMANQSLLRFDQLGLSIERHKEIMGDLQKQYPEMTREVAFQNAMLQQATEKFYNLATAQEALATTSEIASRQIKDNWAFVGEVISKEVMGPIAGDVARAFGAKDFNVTTPVVAANMRQRQRELDDYKKAGVSGFQNQWEALNRLEMPTKYFNEGVSKRQEQVDRMDRVVQVGNRGAAAANLGVVIPEGMLDKYRAITDAIQSGGQVSAEAAQEIDNMSRFIAMNTKVLQDDTYAFDDLSNSAAAAAAQIEDLSGTLLGSVVGMVGKLVDIGAGASQIEALLPSQEEVEARAKQIVDTGKLAGDAISDEIATKMAEADLTKPAQDFIDSTKDAASAQRKAASASESAAKKWETTMNETAGKLKEAFSSMLHSVPGLFSPSEVTEGDLYLAKKGYAIDKPDDWMRRLNDVALNGTKRDDVDLGLIARAVGHPGETDPKALMYLAQQAGIGVYANPEIANQLLNKDAVKGGLHSQEINALGQQTVEAMFGIGTPGGLDYLKVFGVKALDPIQDGLISEVTTKGPIMGGIIAGAMFDGFKDASKQLPWVSALMETIKEQVGRDQAQDQNNNATSDSATSDTVSYTTPAGVGVLH